MVSSFLTIHKLEYGDTHLSEYSTDFADPFSEGGLFVAHTASGSDDVELAQHPLTLEAFMCLV